MGKLADAEPENHGERAIVQLAGCLAAAEGHCPDNIVEGDYGWSVAYDRTRELRKAFDKIAGGRSPRQVLDAEPPISTDTSTRCGGKHEY